MDIRPATAADAAQMSDLLNEIIAIGGTTAHKRPFDPDRMTTHYITNPHSIACHVADLGGLILGFQSLVWADPAHDGDHVLPADWAIIATFTRVGQTQGGVGTQLFQKTRTAAEAANVTAIDATIREWNAGGLRYYSKMGFEDYRREGDAICKKFQIKAG